MATSAPLAAAAAAAGSVPESYFTVALGARAWMALSGEVGNQISCCQWVAPLPGRQDGVATGRVDLRRAAAGDHAHIRMGANDGDGVKASGTQRQAAFSFFSRTMPPSSILRAISSPAKGSITLRWRG